MPSSFIPQLLKKARGLPSVPGVYLMKGEAGAILYIGKALVLPDRVSSYFLPSTDLGPRKQPLLDHVVDFDTIECVSEWEALLLEARLVKDLQPRFNERLLDGKSFPYLAVTMREEFPGVFITRTPGHERFKGARIFGPFLSGGSLRHAVQILQRVFQYRTCELDIRSDNPANRSFRPCLLHSIGQCTAPCANRVSSAAYREDIERFLRFIVSKRSAMLRELRSEMKSASDGLLFERAATLRDQIRAIERLDHRELGRGDPRSDWEGRSDDFITNPLDGVHALQSALGAEAPIRCLEAIDIAHLGGGETVGSKVCFIDGRPFKDGYRRYRVRTAENDDFMAIREVVSRRYRDAGDGLELYPDLVLIDGGAGQLSAALEAFGTLAVKPPLVIGLAKREELIYRAGDPEPLRLPKNSPALKLCQSVRDEAHRFAQRYHHLLRSKRMLGDA